jgi:hypothetical protein
VEHTTPQEGGRVTRIGHPPASESAPGTDRLNASSLEAKESLFSNHLLPRLG